MSNNQYTPYCTIPAVLNNKTNINTSVIKKTDTEFLIKKCNENTNIDNNNRNELDTVFNQESPYKFGPLIICDDIKRINQNSDIYQKYSDIIYDECGNRFNMRNLKNSAGLLQEGYSKNIDVDSHLKNINYYTDKCYYDNWKLSPNSESLDKCNGLKHNSFMLSPNYEAVGRDMKDCFSVCDTGVPCTSTPPTDINCENNVRKRYDFTKNKLQTESCIKPADRGSFKLAPTPDINNINNNNNNISKYPNEKRSLELINSINRGVQHDYYQFFEQNKCKVFPQQRLFNNVTKRSMLPTHHNLEDIGPKYLV